VEFEEGVQRITELSDDVERRAGSDEAEAGDHVTFVTPDS
jgi:hypothetical protein